MTQIFTQNLYNSLESLPYVPIQLGLTSSRLTDKKSSKPTSGGAQVFVTIMPKNLENLQLCVKKCNRQTKGEHLQL